MANGHVWIFEARVYLCESEYIHFTDRSILGRSWGSGSSKQIDQSLLSFSNFYHYVQQGAIKFKYCLFLDFIRKTLILILAQSESF